MARFGVQVEREGLARFVVPAGARYRSPGRRSSSRVMPRRRPISSPPARSAAGRCGSKASGAAAFRAMCALPKRSSSMGAASDGRQLDRGAARRQGGSKAFDLDCNHIPDAAMTLAIAALFADGPTPLRNIASWRVKETDRIAAMATELRKLGARWRRARTIRVERRPHSLPPAGHRHLRRSPHGHVLLAGSLRRLPVRINDPKCVAKTFPDYFDAFGRGNEPVPVIAIDGPSASGKGTVAARVAAHAGLALSGQRSAVSPGGAGCARPVCAGTTSRRRGDCGAWTCASAAGQFDPPGRRVRW
jgi:3-phosphoshikimate 1-carboxyvinyltransferase